MTTRFPQLPVLGHRIKHRKPDLTKTLTLAQIYEVLEADWLYELLPGDGQDDYILQRLQDAFAEATRKS